MDVNSVIKEINNCQDLNVYLCHYNGEYISYCPTVKAVIILFQ